jgi:hypothetical protein
MEAGKDDILDPRRQPLRWEDPPRPLTIAEQFAREWRPVAKALRDRPSQWAVIAEGLAPTKASSLAAKIRRGDVDPFDNDGTGKFEAQQHTAPAHPRVAGREVTVYARYVRFEND